MDDLNYAEDIKIDPEALDIEWMNQPDLMHKYAKHSAITERNLDLAKEALDAGKARIEMDIRGNPGKYGLEKITEGAIQSTILLQDEYQELATAYNETKYEANIAKAVVRAVEQRKTALENLVQLLKASYFAGPVMPRDLTQENMKREENRKNNAKVKITRKPRG